MNYRMIAHTLGKLMMTATAIFLLPLVVALIYGEFSVALAFLFTALISLAIGLPLILFCKPKEEFIFAKEGFVIASGAWLLISAVGALPFVFSGEIPSYANAFFETVSGLTTTGSSILTDVEAMSHGTLFWRSFTHWIGGMGVLVFVMAVLPDVSGRQIHIMRAEMPGPIVGKIVPRAKDTAKILYLIYVAMTLVEVILLCLGDMNLFESILHSFGSAGTGGFGIKADGLASYSAYSQWVITIAMFFFGINFNLYYLLLIKRFKSVIKSTELWTYIGIVVVAITAITINIMNMYSTFSEAFRHASFQVSTIITTTGYSTTDFNLWPGFSKAILLILMFIGGCAGSTAGGFKVSRVVILFNTIKREFRRLIHPRSVSTVRLEGKSLDETTVKSVGTYFALYMACIGIVFLILSLEPFSFETNASAAISCFNNIGPGFDVVGPAGNFSAYSDFSKYTLSVAMLLGRLEIYPLILALLPSTWSRKGN